MTRAEQELSVLEQISQILSDGLEISQLFQRAMAMMSEKLGIERASLLMWDDVSDQVRIVAAIGLTPEEMSRGRYSLGEGVTGRAMAVGKAQVIPDISTESNFLDRTGVTNETDDRQISFICVPVKGAERQVGAISVHKPYVDEATLEADTRLLIIISGLFAQAFRVHHLLQIEKEQLLDENRQLRGNLYSKFRFDNIIGAGPAMLDVLSIIGQVASSRATCLLLGETGCGKELIAKAIHYNSPRKDRPLIRLNCGALSPQLIESELFGHVQGAFTGAVRDSIGRFQAADTGSIFLDEVGTLDPQMQVKLLRVLQEREFERVGDHQTIKVDVRVIAASNLDLAEEMRKGTFREDLYYRLNVVTVNLPPLRNRREDIPQLIDYFLDKYNAENARHLSKISRDMLNTLLRYPWPGNVRELENAIERAVVLSQGEDFIEDLLPLQIRLFAQQVRGDQTDTSIQAMAQKLASDGIRQHDARQGEIYGLVVGELERQLIHQALKQSGGIKARAADLLGINRNTLNKRAKEMGLFTSD